MSDEAPTRPRTPKTGICQLLLHVKTLLTTIHYRPMTQDEIVEATGLSSGTVSRWLNRLHVKPSLVYIHHYRKTGKRGNPPAVWSAGFNREDAEKPLPLRQGEAQRLWRSKQRRQEGVAVTSPAPGVIRHELL